MTELLEKYRDALNRLILLDYDGTLVNYSPDPGAALLPDHIFRLLKSLLEKHDNELYIITGRSHVEIDLIFKKLPINIIAEHGAMMRISGVWNNRVSDRSLWKRSVIPLLNDYTMKCPKSFVEEKRFSLTWHYRNSDPELGRLISEELINSLSQMVHSAHLKIINGNKVVEILNEEVGKGRAVKDLLEHKNFDFILAVGDDATDEEMFESLQEFKNAFTIKIGTGVTYASYRLKDIFEVERLLQKLTE